MGGGPRKKSLGPEDVLPALLYPADSSTERRWLAELRRTRKIRAVGPRLYASIPKDQTVRTLRASWATIVSRLYPQAFITHRTALEFVPSPNGDVFLTAPWNRIVRYPGLVLRFGKGPGPLPSDPPFMSVRCSSQARAFLENLNRKTASRALTQDEVEQRLEQILHTAGEAALNELRDGAREVADELSWRPEMERLDRIIGTLLGTRTERLRGEVGRARAAGEPFDAACLERLQLLVSELRAPIKGIADSFTAKGHTTNKAFFEAYFSNYIEGTRFDIEEAERIVFDKQVPATRRKDAHDVLGTFAIVSDGTEMRRTPADVRALVDLLRTRHARMMAQRPEAQPGEFKKRANFAGDTEFVHPDYVRGTLSKGMDLYRDLAPGLARSIFMMFLVSDVHPFVDGNGRIARIMMNAELVAAGETTIIIPTVFRDDYLQALRALTRRNRPTPVVRALHTAQRFSNLQFAPYPKILAELTRRHWFRESDEARIVIDPS
jgi:hypothetical protein